MFEDYEQENDEVLVRQIPKWILKHRITRTASNKLLTILRLYGGHVDLPKCARILLKTPRDVSSHRKCGGKYVYLGISNGISRTLAAMQHSRFESDKISLMVKVDGLLLFKSSGTQVRLILCMFNKVTPFIVAIFVGDKMPNNNGDFLNDFLHEYELLLKNGFQHNDKVLKYKNFSLCFSCPCKAVLEGY